VLGAVLADSEDTQAAQACWREAAKLLTEIGSPEGVQVRAPLGS
jgi:hypothetical protein